jgi:hypothetical protein
MSICINFSNLWSKALDQKHPILKNHETQFPNQLNVKRLTWKKISITQKDKKITIKKIGIKIEI